MVAAMVGADCHVAHLALAGVIAIVAALQAVGHSVANQMDERVGNLLDNVVIEFSLRAG